MSRPLRLRQPQPPERTIQDAILRYLQWDGRVAWAYRFNTGAQVIETPKTNGGKSRRFVRYAFPGCADVLGQTVDGRFLAVEVKTKTGRATKEQRTFLETVRRHAGIAVLTRSDDDVKDALDIAFGHCCRSTTAISVGLRSRIPYASRTGTRRNLAALRRAGWRILISVKGQLRTEGMRYVLDNGAWSAHQAGEPFDARAFEQAVMALGQGADWIVAPDIVAGGLDSLHFSLEWMPRLKPLEVPLLLAVQDGMSAEDVRPHLGPGIGIFVGGSTAWKLGTLLMWGELARSVGCHLHVGRVNTATRIRLCAAAGATSFDGTSASRFACTLPLLDRARRQPDLLSCQRA